MTRETRDLIERAGDLQAELDNASNDRVGTPWWPDRVAELAAMHQQIATRIQVRDPENAFCCECGAPGRCDARCRACRNGQCI